MIHNVQNRFEKFRRVITNGVLLIAIGLLHTQFALSSDGFGWQFKEFAEKHFFEISKGGAQLPLFSLSKPEMDAACAFWFFYFGMILMPLGLLVHAIEREARRLPVSFLASYMLVVLIGCYMMPNSGMSFIMLPHAIYMWFTNRTGARP